MDQANLSFVGADSKRVEVALGIEDYKEAGTHGLSLSQLYENKYPTETGKASAFSQFCLGAGIRVRSDPLTGMPATSMNEIMHGGLDKSMGPIVRPDGSDRQGTAGRFLYPEVMLQMINSNLVDNKDAYLAPWEDAIAIKTSVTSPRVDQPNIDVTAPEDSRAQVISQLAEPAIMVSITLGEKAYTIPTKSIGLEIADQALEAMTIDKVGLTLSAQARGERIARIEADMGKMINGDTDYGITATSFVNASTFDSTIPGTNVITQKAWVKWLRANYTKMTVTHILADIDSLLELEARAGRPTVFNDTTSQSNLMDAMYSVENMGLPTPKVLILPTSIVGANQIVGFDAKYAMQQMTNVTASYSAIENFVMRRAVSMRFDHGIALFKIHDDSFTGLTIGA